MKEDNNFKLSLKENIPAVKHAEFEMPEHSLLKKLGLLNLPENIKVKIEDGYVKIKIAEDNVPWDEFDAENHSIATKTPGIKEKNSHIIFSLPIKSEQLDYYNNSSMKKALEDRYKKYNPPTRKRKESFNILDLEGNEEIPDIPEDSYLNKILNYSTRERQFLQELFPDLVFNIKVRMKSGPSYRDKINKTLKNNKENKSDKSILIDDIIAERIIISEYNGSREPEDLETACNLVAKFLYAFRINTDFRMKDLKSSTNNTLTDKIYVTKDYIENPKENGYQSLHITIEDKTNKDCTYETQIRSYDMEYQSKRDSNVSHKKYKPRLLNDLSVSRVPTYFEIPNFSNDSGIPKIFEVPLDNSFYHYYEISLDQYNKELNEIEKSVKLSELRRKLAELKKEKDIEK